MTFSTCTRFLKRFALRGLIFGGILVIAVTAMAFLLPHVAQAQSFINPANAVRNLSNSNNWLGLAQGWARNIYLTLLVFELFALGVTTLLFRENLGEFFAGVTLKIVMGGVFFWFIANAGVAGLPGQVVATFTQFGGQLAGNNGDPTAVIAKGFIASTAYFAAAEISKGTDDAAGIGLDVPPDCTFILGTGDCFLAPFISAETSHMVFEFVCDGLGIMILMAIATIYLQFSLITIESYMVMGAGTLFIGFAGSRFTMPFSQGYFAYMMNVGVKLMVMDIILGIENPLLNNVLVSSIGSLSAASFDPLGVSVPAALLLAVGGVMSVIIGAGLVWTIPAFVGSFLTGQSAVSGAAVLSQSLGSLAGSAQMMAQRSAASAHVRNNVSASRNESVVTRPGSRQSSEKMAPASASGGVRESFQNAGSGSSGGPISSGGGASTAVHSSSASPVSNGMTDALGMNSAPRITVSVPERAGAGTGAARPAPLRSEQAPTNNTSMSAGRNVEQLGPGGENMDTFASSGRNAIRSSGEAGLNDRSPAEIEQMSVPEGQRAIANTDMSKLSPARREALQKNKPLAAAAQKSFREEARRERRGAEISSAYSISGLAQAAPHDIGDARAVDVRLSNPDRL